VTRVSLHGGVCPCCAKRFKRAAEGWSRIAVRAKPARFVIYLALCPGHPLARLSHVLRDLFGLDISEGALVNILDASESLLPCRRA